MPNSSHTGILVFTLTTSLRPSMSIATAPLRLGTCWSRCRLYYGVRSTRSSAGRSSCTTSTATAASPALSSPRSWWPSTS
ncbi:hypothetical protein FOCC_FOCC007627 [Frankliniella occidentalis]|nr:hypothetical protein FOCC_FOCC007627 [Frankliniella occidentalis]